MLFRPEVLSAQRRGWLGGVRLSQSAALRWLSVASVALVALLVLFVATASYTRRTRVVGLLAPASGLATVHAPVDGVLGTLHAEEGREVAAGEVLGVVAASASPGNGGDRAEELRQTLERRLRELVATRTLLRDSEHRRRHALLRQRLEYGQELGSLVQEQATRRQQQAALERSLQQWEPLVAQGFVSRLQWQQREAEVISGQAALQSLMRQEAVARRESLGLQQTLDDLPAQIRLADDALAREQAMLDRQLLDLDSARRLAIAAPVRGTVTAVQVKAGEAVQSGQALLSVLPADGRLDAELLVPSRAIGFVTEGDAVLLRYHAFPYQKFGHQRGVVTRVARTALDPAQARSLLRGVPMQEPFYRVSVELTSQVLPTRSGTQALRAGMLLDADILGENRRLIEWLFEPLLALRRAVATDRAVR
jgi:membrane fusion protein